MQSLFELATATLIENRRVGDVDIKIPALQIRFLQAESCVAASDLAKTYSIKPLVTVDDEALFGELAILRYLQKDGWDGVWVDTFHSRGKKKVVWSAMPPEGAGTMSKGAEELFDQIVEKNGGKSSGFFDVFAWRGTEYVFIEYKGRGDSPNKNESRWIGAALAAGVEPEQLFFVVY